MAIERCGADGRRLFRSYSRLDESCAELLLPRNPEELGQMIIAARDQGRRVTLRAGGWSLHDQALNDDLVISLEYLDRIEPVDVAAKEVTVGAAATWSKVVDATLAHDLVPYVVPTGEDITCGGSLASDGISRYSPSFGSESLHVRGLEVLEVGRTTPRWIERPDRADESEDAQLFRAIIGGFGYLAVVTRITYGLLSLSHVGGRSPHNAKVRVTTTLECRDSFAELIARQKETLLDDVQQDLDVDLEDFDIPEEPDPYRFPAVYAVAFPHDKDGRGAVYRSHYSRGDVGPPYVIYRPRAWWRKWMTLILTSSTFKKLINDSVWWSMKRDQGRRFVNDVKDYMFFMQGQVIGKEWYEDPPHRLLPVVQQTFVMPFDKTEAFMKETVRILEEADLEPTLLEFLFMPKDRILMSASYEMTSFAITLAFQDIESAERQEKVIACLRSLSETLLEYGGRIHLTKNVYAAPEVLREMFDDNAREFLALKRRYDPQHVLRNRFFERVFGDVGEG